MLDLRFGLSCPDVYLGHVKNLSREEMCLVTSFTLVSVCFQLPSVLFLPRLVCVGARGAHLSLCVRAGLRPALRCVPGMPELVLALTPLPAASTAPASCSVHQHSDPSTFCLAHPPLRGWAICVPSRVVWANPVSFRRRLSELLPFGGSLLSDLLSPCVILSVLPSSLPSWPPAWALFSREPSCEVCKPWFFFYYYFFIIIFQMSFIILKKQGHYVYF